MLSVNGRNSECKGTRGDHRSVRDRSGWPRVDDGQSPAMRFGQWWIASETLQWSFAQGWIASKVLQWCLPNGRSQVKSCDSVCPRVDRGWNPEMVFAQGWIAKWLRDDCATILNQDRSANGRCNGSSGNCKGGIAKGEGCWWQQMGIVKT